MLGEADSLLWGDSDGRRRNLRGRSAITRDRHGVIKYPKSLCEACNTSRSRPLDLAYDEFSLAVRRTRRWSRKLNLEAIYGQAWQFRSLDLGRYYAKHFGCRMVRTGIEVPGSLRAFLDGAVDLHDSTMTLCTTADVRRNLHRGLSITGDFIEVDRAATEIRRCVMAAFVGRVGVRYEWRADATEAPTSFFHGARPRIARYRQDEDLLR